MAEDKDEKIGNLMMKLMQTMTFVMACDFLEEEGVLPKVDKDQRSKLTRRFDVWCELRVNEGKLNKEQEEQDKEAQRQADIAILRNRMGLPQIDNRH